MKMKSIIYSQFYRLMNKIVAMTSAKKAKWKPANLKPREFMQPYIEKRVVKMRAEHVEMKKLLFVQRRMD